MQPRHILLPLLALLAGCSATPTSDAMGGVPMGASRQAVLESAYAFAHPARLAGQPAQAARASAQVEWLAEALPRDQQWIAASGLLFPELRSARSELRAALGLDPAAAPGTTVRALWTAATALQANDRAAATTALAPVAPGGGQATLARLEALPPVPVTSRATALAQHEMSRMMQEDNGQ